MNGSVSFFLFSSRGWKFSATRRYYRPRLPARVGSKGGRPPQRAFPAAATRSNHRSSFASSDGGNASRAGLRDVGGALRPVQEPDHLAGPDVTVPFERRRSLPQAMSVAHGAPADLSQPTPIAPRNGRALRFRGCPRARPRAKDRPAVRKATRRRTRDLIELSGDPQTRLVRMLWAGPRERLPYRVRRVAELPPAIRLIMANCAAGINATATDCGDSGRISRPDQRAISRREKAKSRRCLAVSARRNPIVDQELAASTRSAESSGMNHPARSGCSECAAHFFRARAVESAVRGAGSIRSADIRDEAVPGHRSGAGIVKSGFGTPYRGLQIEFLRVGARYADRRKIRGLDDYFFFPPNAPRWWEKADPRLKVPPISSAPGP